MNINIYLYILLSLIAIIVFIKILHIAVQLKTVQGKFILMKYENLANTLSYQGTCYVEMRKNKQQVENVELREYMINVIAFSYVVNSLSPNETFTLTEKYLAKVVEKVTITIQTILATSIQDTISLDETVQKLLENEIAQYNTFYSIIDTNYYIVDADKVADSILQRELSSYEIQLISLIEDILVKFEKQRC